MEAIHRGAARSGFRSLPQWQRVALVALAVIVAIQVGAVGVRRHRGKIGDFDVNREFGRRFLTHENLYGGGSFNYMPAAAMAHAPLAIGPPSVAIGARYLVAVLCLVAIFRMLTAMTRDQLSAARMNAVGISLVTTGLALHYLHRDFDDGGPHVILLAMAVAGIYWAWRGREAIAAGWFGLVIVLKMTPALLLPYFLWKRRWRLFAYTALATVLWIVLPAAWMGPAAWWSHQKQWNDMAFGIGVGRHDPMRIANEVRIQNQALRPAVKRIFVEYPPEHPNYLGHALDAPLIKLSEGKAEHVATVVMGLIAAACAWKSRRAFFGPRDPRWLLETSGVLVLMVLFSPVTWLQHVVFIIPGLFLLCVDWFSGRRWPAWARILMGLYLLFSLVLNREILGRPTYMAVLSFYTHTLAMLIVLTLLLALEPTAREPAKPV